MLYDLGERSPQVHGSCFVADSAQLIGAVVLEPNASVWFNVVIRGDNDVVTIGEDSNVQDGSVIHTDSGIPVRLGRGVTVGHKVMLHGCEVADYSLIGIGSVILNRARIGKYCLVGAGALITEGKQIPEGSVVFGAPGKVVRQVTDAERMVLEGSAAHYVQNGQRYRDELRKR